MSFGLINSLKKEVLFFFIGWDDKLSSLLLYDSKERYRLGDLPLSGQCVKVSRGVGLVPVVFLERASVSNIAWGSFNFQRLSLSTNRSYGVPAFRILGGSGSFCTPREGFYHLNGQYFPSGFSPGLLPESRIRGLIEYSIIGLDTKGNYSFFLDTVIPAGEFSHWHNHWINIFQKSVQCTCRIIAAPELIISQMLSSFFFPGRVIWGLVK